MAKTLYLDFETRSTCDLKTAGSYEYACHPSTEVVCATYAFDDGEVQLWDALSEHFIPGDLYVGLMDENVTIVGHNFANFDRFILDKVLRIVVPPHRIHDTMCQSYAMGLPGSLDKAAQAVGLTHQKDMKASRVMLQLAQPRTLDPLTWYTPEQFPEKFATLHAYAKKDVEATRELYQRTMKLTPTEHGIFQFDMVMNERGVPVDVESLKKAIEVVEREKAKFDLEMRKLTDNVVLSTDATGQIRHWLKLKGVETPGVAKSHVLEMLSRHALPKGVKEVLLLRQEAAKSSTAKLQAMLSRAGSDGRVRCGFQYSGANTRRWAGRGAQFQNFKRGSAPGQFWDLLKSDELEIVFHSVLDVISQSLRGFIQAKPGHLLMGADYSSVEARCLAWLSNEVEVLKIFSRSGDIYKFAAAQIFGVDESKVTAEQRQIGKVAILALGYGGGKGAFQSMAKNYGVIVTDERAEEIKTAWRLRNKRTVQYWYDVEKAAVSAVQTPGIKCSAGPKNRQVTFIKKGSFLWCKLPSHGVLCYPYPELRLVDTPWGDKRQALTYMTVNSLTRKWERTSTYGGSLVENITQSLARDLLATAMVELEKAGYPVIATIHDEVICEVPWGGKTLHGLVKIMETPPKWAVNLPIRAEGWDGTRYG